MIMVIKHTCARNKNPFIHKRTKGFRGTTSFRRIRHPAHSSRTIIQGSL